MRLVFATQDLTLANRSFEGFPLLIGADGWPVQPAQSFLWHILIESGESLSTLTWEAYGRRLYDYFAFTEANTLTGTMKPQLTALAFFRDTEIGQSAN